MRLNLKNLLIDKRRFLPPFIMSKFIFFLEKILFLTMNIFNKNISNTY